MKNILYAILYLLFMCQRGHFFEREKYEYIRKKFEYATEILNLEIGASQSKDVEIKIDFFNTTNITLANFTNSHIIQSSDNVYFLSGSEVFLWADFNQINKTYSLPDLEGSVAMVKTSQAFHDKTFILTSFKNGVSYVYMVDNNEEPIHIQSLKHEDELKDAKFFTNGGSLYLVALHAKATIFYQYLGEHFDQTHAITSKFSRSESFPYLNSEIIVFMDKGAITVYRFEGRLQKIQFLKIPRCYNFKTYRVQSKVYMIVFAGEDDFMYTWDYINAEFVYYEEFQPSNVTEMATISLADNIPLILFVSKFGVQVHRISMNTVRYVGYLKFEDPLDVILSVTGKEKHLQIFWKQSDEVLRLLDIKYALHYSEIVNSVLYGDPLENCLSTLQDKLEEELNEYLVETPTNSKQKRSDASDDYDVDLEPDFDPYESEVAKLNSTIREFQQEIVAILSTLNEITSDVINKDVLIKGNLKSGELTAKALNVNTINDIEWVPEEWLSYSKNQTISKPIETNTLNSENVDVLNWTFLDDVIVNKENITLRKPVKINNLECGHLSVDVVNDISFKDIYLKSSGNPVKGLKTFNTITIKNLESPNITYPSCNSKIDPNQLTFKPNLKVNNLRVQTINNVTWDEFKDQMEKRKINVTINRLQTKKINGINIDDILTKTTDQTISSKFNFNKVTVNNLNLTKVNGIDFKKEIVLINSTDAIIEGPVKIKNLKTTAQRKHYNKVKILGDLHVKKIDLSENAKVLLKGDEFKFDISKKYWLIDTNQTIRVNFKLSNATINDLHTKAINGMETGKNRNYYFKQLNVTGNIKLNPDSEHTPNWSELNDNIVRKTGGYKISGKKIFNGTIVVQDANIGYLNNVEVDKIPTVKTDDLSGYTFDTMMIKGNLTLKKTIVDAINDIEVKKMYDNVKFIDEDMRFKKLHLENVFIEELHIENNLNGRNVPEYVNEINKIDKIEQVENVTTEGNIDVGSVYNVKSINGIPIKLIEEAVRKGAIMTGNITFEEDVFIENLFVTHLNGINIPELVKRLFYRNRKQSISAVYNFDVLKTGELSANQINDYNVETLIDVTNLSPQTLKGNFEFKSVKFLGTLQGKLPCNLNDVATLLKNPNKETWDSVIVKGNITTLTKDNSLQEIIDNVVRLDKSNVIDGPVTFHSTVHANHVKSTKDINFVNIKSIFDDALRKTLPSQLVAGQKVFSKLTCGSARVNGNSDIPIVNAILIRNLNDSIITKDMVHNITVKGHKVFNSGLKSSHLRTETLSGLKPENLVNLDDLKPIPHVVFDTLNVSGNLTVNYINDNIDFQEFLKNRFLKNSSGEQELFGVYYFEKMELRAPSKISQINNILIDDIVFNNGSRHNVTGFKRFSGNLRIHGDVTVDILNGVNITEKYQRSVFGNKNSTLKENMTLQNNVEINNNITADSINRIPISDIKRFMESDELGRETIQIDRILDKIGNIVQSYHVKIDDLPEEYMYLEKSQNFQIHIPNTVSAEVIEGKYHVLLHITGEESGDVCGLPKSCNCQNQHILQMSHHYEMQTLGSKQYERVFSYQSDKMIAHLITYSVSYNRICARNNSSNFPDESTTLTWITSNEPNSKPKTYLKYNLIDGFITGAKFFVYLDETYVVISRFYTSLSKTHNLDCVIFKFGHDEDTIELIQKIPTKGAWTVHLFNSYQGLILVIGNIYDSSKIISGTNTDIYIFNVRSRQFEFLRKFVGAGAISIADIVLDTDTQIVLAQRDSPLIILKYNPIHENFHIFQSLHLESEVVSVSRFYLGGSTKDAHLAVITENNRFFLYGYKHIEGWKLESDGEIDGLRALVPFSLNGVTHLLAPSTKSSSLLTVQKYG